MSLMTSPMALRARTLVRGTRFGRLALAWLKRDGYEQALNRAMQDAVKPGDIVWDVGANIGEYATLFAEWAGPTGKVFAFEPSSDTLERLRPVVAPCLNVVVVAKGLSDHEGVSAFVKDDHPDGATFRIPSPDEAVGANDSITLTTGDAVIASGEVERPNVVKIDIEAHELEALLGMEQVIADPTCRHIFVEVHFFLLAPQGRDNVPRTIEALLKKHGYRLSWVDQSHIHARRPNG